MTPYPEPNSADTPAASWQPMETAPKDGTEILVYGEHSGMNVMFYMAGKFREKVSMWVLRSAPTHWQPLPAMPNSADPAHYTPNHVSAEQVRKEQNR